MKTFTICGSMRFSEQMKEIAYYLESDKRYNILQCTYCTDDITPTQDEIMQITKAHYKKIDLSDGIYVVNIDGYIGESVQQEIEYTRKCGKEVIFHCDL